jgi:RHS repeat-associated protein
MSSRVTGATTASTLTYNALDQLQRWSGTTASATNEEWYLYDATGNRVLRRSASTTSSGNPATAAATITVSAFGLAEHTYSYGGSGTNATNAANNYYYSLSGRLIGAFNGTSTNLFLTDLLGSIVATTSNISGSAAVLGNQLYGPYGNKRYTAGTIGTAKGYTGQYADDLSGLDYYVARYYDPVSGRFLSADTQQDNLHGFDPYAYVAGNPETTSDPTGHSGETGVDNPIGQLISDVQQFLNSQNNTIVQTVENAGGSAAEGEIVADAVVTGEEIVAGETAPMWIPALLLGIILSIPSDSASPSNSANSNQSNTPATTGITPTPGATPATNASGAGARVPNRPLSGDSESYLFKNLATILPGETYVDNGLRVDRNGKPTTSKAGGTDIDLETTTKVINVGTYSKFYDRGTTTINEKTIQKFYTAMGTYMKYAASVGKPVYFLYDMAWSTLDIPTDVQNWLMKRGIGVVRFNSR